MKTLSKIKLNQFSKDELDQRKLNALKGGCTCGNYCIDSCYCGVFADSATQAGTGFGVLNPRTNNWMWNY